MEQKYDSNRVNKVKFYIDSYKESFNLFLDYTKDLNLSRNEKNYPLSLEYYVNEMELRLLILLKFVFVLDKEWIRNREGYSFILSEVFFIKSCKDILKISPKTGDFAENLMNEIYPLLISLFSKVDVETYNALTNKKIKSHIAPAMRVA